MYALQAVLGEAKRPGAYRLVWLCQSPPKPDCGRWDGTLCRWSLSPPGSEGFPPGRAVLSSLGALTFSSGLCFCVSTAVRLPSPTSPLQRQPGPYPAWLLSPETAKFNLSVQLIQLISKIQQIRELALQSTLQSMLLNGVTSAKGIAPVISTLIFYEFGRNCYGYY